MSLPSSRAGPGGCAVLGVLAWLGYRFLVQVDASPLMIWLYGGVAAVAGLMALSRLISAFRRWRMLAAMQKPKGLYGRTEAPTAKDAERLGLSFSNEDGDGIPLGTTGNKIIYWRGKGHMSVRAPTEGGKTESSAAPICFALGTHRNLIVTAKGAELAILCGSYRAKVLGQQVVNIDPWRTLEACSLPSHDLNPIGHLVKLAETGNGELVDKARAIAQILKPEPERGAGENQVFLSQGRDILTWSMAYLAVCEADTGELCCNLPYLQKMLGGSQDDLITFFQDMYRCDELDGAISRAGARFLGKFDRAGRSMESFLTEAQDALQIFAPPSPLARSIEYSDFDPTDLKRKPMSVFIIIPPEKALTHGVFAGLCLNTLIDASIEADRFEPRLTVVADEFANLSEGKLPSILPTLYIGRSRGVQLITYVQDTESYARYGKESSAFTTQSEVILAWGIRSTKDADDYAKRAGQRSIVGESGSAPISQADDGKLSLSLAEKGIPLMRADEFLHLPDFTAMLLYKQNPPLIIDLVSYRMVEPWRSHAHPVPGAPPADDLPVRFHA